MYPLSEKTNRIFAYFSTIIAIGLIALYLSVVIFTKLQIVYYPGLKVALGAAIAAAIYSPLYPKYAKSNPDLSLGALVLLNSLYFYVVVDYLGGPLSAYVFLLYLVIIISFFIDKKWGIASGVFGIAYIFIYYFFYRTDLLSLSAPIISVITISAMSYLVGEEYRRIIGEKEKLESQNSNLTANQSKEEALLSSIADGVYVVDMDRNLTMFNTAAEEMTGWSEKEAVGLKCWTVMNLKNEQDVSVCQKDCPALAVWNSGQNVMRSDSCFVKHKGKKSVQISSSYAPIHDSQGRLTGAICVFRDITAQKEVERERNEFISTASHELRTPITAMEGYMELIENEKICKIDDKAKEYVEKARHTATGMSNLVKNLLSVTKIEDGRVQTNIEKFSVHDLVADTIEGMQAAAQNKGLYLRLVESSNLNVKGEKAVGRSLNVVADREQIKEVLFNLIENGIKFTTEGGVSISISYDKDFATVCVGDTGMGIPTDGQKHIFEKFYRVDNSATREVGGTGLGLFITRSIIEMLGGTIWLESQAGKGTKFFFTIPRSLD